jgi:hypothetical protein
MTKSERIRAYITEPVLSGLILSLLINAYGLGKNAAFMHDEARDILSLGVVLLGAALALWIGLFWISSSEFGHWLASKGMLEDINAAYITSAVVLLTGCVLSILCAHVSAAHTLLQMLGEFSALYGLASMPTLLNNTRHLLQLHSLYSRQPRPVPEAKSASR